jgi:hypothetical protein
VKRGPNKNGVVAIQRVGGKTKRSEGGGTRMGEEPEARASDRASVGRIFGYLGVGGVDDGAGKEGRSDLAKD